MDHGPLSITDAAARFRAGSFSPLELFERCLKRIDAYEPAVQAWAFFDRDRARDDAKRLTDELKAGKDKGPLHGIPIGVKDIIDVFDMPTGCGSAVWKNSYARRDAECVRRLREGGALIMGKTATTPYAYLDPCETRNPWKTDRTPGGSSSGSAVAVTCGMVLAAISTQTGGSTIRPAAYCGVAAIKPSYGRVSTDGVLPLAPSLDHVGIMATDMEGLATVLHVIAGDFGDPERVYTVGVLAAEMPAECRAAVNTFAARVKKAGRQVVSLTPPPAFDEYRWDYRAVIGPEAAAVHLERKARRPDDYPPQISDLIDHGKRTPTGERTAAKLRMLHAREKGWKDLFGPADVLLTPAAPGSAPPMATTGDPVMNIPWSFTGLPAVCVPVGFAEDGLPVAVQIIGKPGSDAAVLKFVADLAPGVTRLPPVPSVPA